MRIHICLNSTIISSILKLIPAKKEFPLNDIEQFKFFPKVAYLKDECKYAPYLENFYHSFHSTVK